MIMAPVTRFALGSIAVGIVVLAMKYGAWRVTGSVALYSDALESIINVVAAVAVLFVVRFSAKPADENHNFGHYKAEYFSAVLEGILIGIAALSIFHEAYLAFFSPRAIAAPLEGILINAAASVLNALWCRVLIVQGRKHRSPALVADGRHLFSDVLSSGGVLIGIVLATLTGWWVLDPLLAMAVGVSILWHGFQLVRDSIGGLMDASPARDVVDGIRTTINSHCGQALEVHDLRIRQAARATFIDFHMVVDGKMSVSAAHDICDTIEAALRRQTPGAIITIHVEPEHKAKNHEGFRAG